MERLVRALRWKLGIPVDGEAFPEFCARASRANDYERMAEGVASSLAEYAALCFRYKLGLLADHVATRDDVEAMEAFCRHVNEWIREAEHFRSNLISRRIHQSVEARRAQSNGGGREPVTAATSTNPATGAAQMEIGKRPLPPGSPAPAPSPLKAEYARPASAIDGPAPAPAANAGQWKYLPLPPGPDPHEENAVAAAASPEGYQVVAARVRGKKHKHEGTHCDDWFEVGTSGLWTVIAVSDGAGSKKLSRVGARASTQAAVKHLSEKLKDLVVDERDWTNETLSRDPATGAFPVPDLQQAQVALHGAVHAAYEAVAEAARSRAGNPEYAKLLGGRAVDVNDLSATLLLAIHTRVKFHEKQYSLVLACQVGDGMTAAVNTAGALTLLGAADSGEYSGETDFLTSRNKLEPANLVAKTYAFFSPLRALMVMTDGVSDDYFPQDPALLRLYADLVLNGAIAVDAFDEARANEALRAAGARFKDVAELRLAAEAWNRGAERLTNGNAAQVVPLRHAQSLADAAGVAVEDLAKHPALLKAAAVSGDPSAERDDDGPSAAAPEQRLLEWLDSYHVRGSFDDRTLVVLYPGGKAP